MQIIVDTREKYPWIFEDMDSSIIHQKLDTGDYAIEGYEDLLCIERKMSVAELAGNVTAKRFGRELERMALFPHKFLILEFDYSDVDNFPLGSEIPKRVQSQIKVRGPYITKCLSRIMIKYGVQVLFCGNKVYAEHIAYSIMKEIYEKNK